MKETTRNNIKKVGLTSNMLLGAGAIAGKATDLYAPHGLNSFENFLHYNTGDWINGVANVVVAGLVLNKLFPNASRASRTTANVAFSAGLILLAETVQLPHFPFGYADHMDIPYGLASVASATAMGLGDVFEKPRRG